MNISVRVNARALRAVLGVVMMSLSGAAPTAPPKATFTTFDVPGDTFGINPKGITPGGEITGSYCTAQFPTQFPCHGFVRDPKGDITTFDLPGDAFGTFPIAINPAGVITGFYIDANFVFHGFLRAPDGTLSTFDGPSAIATQPVGIDPRGFITGFWLDSNSNPHSFVRAPDGTFTSFDPAMNTNNSGVINAAGAVTGSFADNNGLTHGFLRAPDGAVTTFDAPSVCKTLNGTFATGIDSAGVIAGTYWDAGCVHFHGFLRARDGAFTTIDIHVPGTTDTEVDAINPEGAISGIYFTSSRIFGFLRSPSGVVTTYSAPADSVGPNDAAVNPAGVITGFYIDSSGGHGYVWTPEGK
jgi:hypothetical protein